MSHVMVNNLIPLKNGSSFKHPQSCIYEVTCVSSVYVKRLLHRILPVQPHPFQLPTRKGYGLSAPSKAIAWSNCWMKNDKKIIDFIGIRIDNKYRSLLTILGHALRWEAEKVVSCNKLNRFHTHTKIHVLVCLEQTMMSV